MSDFRHLPKRVHVHTDAYAENIGISLKPLPAGPRLMGEEAEYVRADIHQEVVRALRWVSGRYEQTLAGESVRDVDECLSHAQTVLRGGVS